MFYTYILFSLKDHKLYIGSTSDWENRIKRHNHGQVISTKHRRPLKLIFYEAFVTSAEAKSREVYLKSGAGRKKSLPNAQNYIKKSLITNSSNKVRPILSAQIFG